MKKKLKILLTVMVSLVLSSLSANTIFLAGTPYINRPFLAELRSSPGRMISYTSSYIAALRDGRSGVTKYTQSRVTEYTAGQQSTGTIASGSTSQSLPPPERPEDFEAQGYTKIGNDTYTRENVSARTVEIYFGEDAQFEKRTLQTGEGTVEAWVPL